jgi:hypothetical protein
VIFWNFSTITSFILNNYPKHNWFGSFSHIIPWIIWNPCYLMGYDSQKEIGQMSEAGQRVILDVPGANKAQTLSFPLGETELSVSHLPGLRMSMSQGVQLIRFSDFKSINKTAFQYSSNICPLILLSQGRCYKTIPNIKKQLNSNHTPTLVWKPYSNANTGASYSHTHSPFHSPYYGQCLFCNFSCFSTSPG